MGAWPEIRERLVQLGIQESERLEDVRRIRGRFGEMCELGSPALPDYTLHNVTHSDNLIHLLGSLKEELGARLDLNCYEAYLLAASAYLHDLGMFFDPTRFEEQILPNLAMRFDPLLCKGDYCDKLKNYTDSVHSRTTDMQIRLTHNLLSIYMLQDDPANFAIDEDDLPYLKPICRGHRVTNLHLQDKCDCYRTKRRNRNNIRLALLTMLLRLSDEFDFYDNRAPKMVFEHRQPHFLRNPAALEHWMKHYLVADPDIRLKKERYGEVVWLECEVDVRVPSGEVNGNTYQAFFKPLLRKHIDKANKYDLNVTRLPHPYIRRLGVDGIRLVMGSIEEGPPLPMEILDRIRTSRCQDMLRFLDELRGELGEKDNVAPWDADRPDKEEERRVAPRDADESEEILLPLSADELRNMLECGEEDEISLSTAELEGPFVVSRPVRIVGKGHPTLWASKGPVLCIQSEGVQVENLLISTADEDSSIALQAVPGTNPRLVHVTMTGMLDVPFGASEEKESSSSETDSAEPFLSVEPPFLEFQMLPHRKKVPPQQLRLRNTGGGNWSGKILSDVLWLEVDSAEVTCPAGEEATVQVSLSARAFRLRRLKYNAREAVILEGHGQRLVVSACLITKPVDPMEDRTAETSKTYRIEL